MSELASEEKRETQKETPDSLLKRVEERLGQIKNPLSPQIEAILKESTRVVFSSERRNREEREAALSLLGLFSHNNWPSAKKRTRGSLKDREKGGVELEAHWRVNRKDKDYLILSSTGRVNLGGKRDSKVDHFLGKMEVAADCFEGIKACLEKRRGPRLLVCVDDLGVILDAISIDRGERLVLSSPAFNEAKIIEEASLESLEELITAHVYPPKVEMFFGEEKTSES